MSDSRDEADGASPDRTGTEELENCAHCGSKLPNDVWCPIRTDTDADGRVRIRSFCDESCREAWVANHAGADDGEADT